MQLRVGAVLLLSCWMLHLASGLQCYSCTGKTKTCTTTSECVSENNCLILSIKGNMIIHQCIKSSDCSIKGINKLYPEYPDFMYECCSGDLCNHGSPVATATPILTAVGLLLSVCWCWI